MRIHLNKLGTPIPTEALPEPDIDMTLPTLTLQRNEDGDFVKASYVDQGYTHYEVLCVGAAGGHGGRSVRRVGDDITRKWGGGGGGGGMHAAQGLLSALPSSVPILVGQAGADGENGSSTDPNPFVPSQPGGDGGYSSFGDICQASGGKGGLGVASSSVYPGAAGSEGGIGGRILVGGGAAGSSTSEPGAQGSWDGTIGAGGGGGRGGRYFDIYIWYHTQIYREELQEATAGGRGSFSYVDTSTYGERGHPSIDNDYGKLIIPGGGGGARPTPLLKFGSRATGYSPNGVVLIRLMRIA